ncbi:putative protein kinase RLK-Pelle-LRR-I-1 family [Helianthus annuus]|uniref:Putative tyrosine-protein kinase, neurotrophic receptor, type 3 n=1 Tax=Helianthus annuus TaxID=4232 RepID=A0A251V6N5_HELAN|nr:putative protein kinase RLK-Pelle-LRR-I-1 family [Helianthus annuus]KAJ0592622.1 putative protein kinase RLK-Pelle-LRR-I-1 family [Helianthus annuus]KAJ0600230.1 putative protein kinase RLK-Pelle-LRR-I-1 family [Helianthus annuus]KAJ0607617.1 putative protein kinase RLK-Pelle-LRR-I-1 family [Helianthus annuus]KAJ0767682.1 putative protein kinase RLK-Pelle-LRR-I-1 family [Helianthus annuus]
MKITLPDILLLTDKFSEQNLIPFGGCGYSEVYKAELDHFNNIEWKNKDELLKRHSTVAIKRINRENQQREKGFLLEVETLRNCTHSNIVSLFGFCDEGGEMIVVLEYASNGSLDDYLRDNDKMTNLTWTQRIQICCGIAHGLKYLHTKNVIHGDIRSSNILLNDKMVAKIAHFGNRAYRHPNSIHNVYTDPESIYLKEESDIYSFGVVLFEIMCGTLDCPPITTGKHFLDGTLKQIIDPRMRADDGNHLMLKGGLNQASLNTFSIIASQCLKKSSWQRPSIEGVIRELDKAYHFQVSNLFKYSLGF